MEWFTVTLGLYRRVFSRGLDLGIRNWPVAATAVAYAAILWIGTFFALRLGLAGGFLMSLATAACVSSFLYLTEMVVRTSKVSLDDFARSFGVYLGDVVGIFFLSWLFFSLVTPALMQLRQGLALFACVNVAVFIFFNAVPELIYLGHHSSLSLLTESYRFVSANWLEWLPLALLTALIWALMPSALDLGAGPLLLLIPLFYLLMIIRGLLFLELNGSSYRSRLFRHRAGG